VHGAGAQSAIGMKSPREPEQLDFQDPTFDNLWTYTVTPQCQWVILLVTLTLFRAFFTCTTAKKLLAKILMRFSNNVKKFQKSLEIQFSDNVRRT
jgi:hypothetical protein